MSPVIIYGHSNRKRCAGYLITAINAYTAHSSSVPVPIVAMKSQAAGVKIM